MTLIEGVGDEVTDFFIVLGVLLVGWLAWCSTSISDQPLISTVLYILQDRTRTRIAELRASHQSGNSTRLSTLQISEEETPDANTSSNNDVETSCPEMSVTEPDRLSEATTASEEVLIEAMDSFSSEDGTLTQQTEKVDTSEVTSVSESTDTADIASIEPAADLSPSDVNEISIKLKFINDDQKVVTGKLKELLGDFKRRHFEIELQSQKLVRLIFNGQVLQPDSQTLEHCGLYNNCVVHCLVHQPRPTSAPSSQASTMDNSSSMYFNPQAFQDIPSAAGISSVHNDWDLSRLLVSILTLILGLAWYSRYHYSQLFTATTTFSLYAMTAIFTVSLFSIFFPDQDGIRNIE